MSNILQSNQSRCIEKEHLGFSFSYFMYLVQISNSKGVTNVYINQNFNINGFGSCTKILAL